jgi:CubicO group peptidase (beta-lactamase class C family)
MALLLLLLQLQLGSASASIDDAVRDGLARGVFPGAVVVVGTRDSILLAKGYGRLTWSARSAVPEPDSTLYDLASLTKVVATTPAILLLVQRGQVRLDRPVQDYLPDFQGAGKERVTVRNLLSHTSGLRADLPLDKEAADAAAARRLVMAEPLRWPPGRRVVYSDLNAMLLGWIVEAVSGEPLDRFTREQVFGPAGMTETRFVPPRALWHRTAPVSTWHGTPVMGRVFDQNAAKLGGVSGHAGLYSTGMDLARYAQIWLRGGRTAQCRPLLQPDLVSLFTRRAGGDRALGWELRDTTSSDNTGTRMAATTYGHTGYTGTSLWIDPQHGLFVVLLTNRVNAPRARRSITQLKRIRGLVADGAVRLFDALPPAARARAVGQAC